MREQQPLKVDEALNLILKNIRTLPTEEIDLLQSEGRVLAEPLIAGHSLPAFDRSSMDGFAVRARDTAGANPNNPVRLKVIEAVPAGGVATRKVEPGTAIRIMTGAGIPEGADAVVMLEKTHGLELGGEVFVDVLAEIAEGENINFTGEDVKAGEVLLQDGTIIGPGEAALLATFGYGKVKVYRRPVVGICATGNEILPVEAELEPGKIRNSNSYLTAAQVSRIGGIPKFFGIIPDSLEEAVRRMEEALAESDVLITAGGVAAGDLDLMDEVFQKLGAEILFDKLWMRPGKSTTVAVRGDKIVFGLSGNPGACFVGFELIVRPVLLRMANVPLEQARLPEYWAILDQDFRKPSAFPLYIRARYYFKGNELYVTPAGKDHSALTRTIQLANCLACIPAGGQGAAAGTKVKIYPFTWAGSSDSLV